MDVKGDGNCLFYSILSFLLGTKIEDPEIVKIFKSKLAELIIRNKKLLTEDTNIIHFSHESYKNCCDLYKSKTKYHNDRFCTFENSEHGRMKATNFNEFVEAFKMPYTWGGSEILSIISGLTGLSILTCEGPKTKKNPVSWCLYKPKNIPGFRKIIPGAEILLTFINKNHFQVLVPRNINDIPRTILPYYKPKRKIDTVTDEDLQEFPLKKDYPSNPSVEKHKDEDSHSPVKKKQKDYPSHASPVVEVNDYTPNVSPKKQRDQKSYSTPKENQRESRSPSSFDIEEKDYSQVSSHEKHEDQELSHSSLKREKVESENNITNNLPKKQKKQHEEPSPDKNDATYTNIRHISNLGLVNEVEMEPSIIHYKFSKARSFKDLKELGFSFHESKGYFLCDICSKFDSEKTPKITFEYNGPKEFTEKEKVLRQFINLKKTLKRHLTTSINHKECLMKNSKTEEEKVKTTSINEEVGMRIGRNCYFLFYKGRPYIDFEDMILLQDLNGLYVGDINHSRKFPASYRPFVCNEVMDRVRNYLNSALQQTGFKPPINIAFDKATYKHRPRQFVAAITVVPDAEDFLRPIALGLPTISGTYGIDFARSAKATMDSYSIANLQIEGGTMDGDNFNLNTHGNFDDLYDINKGDVYWGYDGMHRSGLVDTHMIKREDFSWLTEMTATCMRCYNMFN